MSMNSDHEQGVLQSRSAELREYESKPVKSSVVESSDSVFRLEPHALIRLIQCPHCSQPLRVPLRLPCGNTICRSCLPPLKRRVGLAYLQSEGREEGFTCFWKGKGCGDDRNPHDGLSSEHALTDCGVDFVLSRILDVFEKALRDFDADEHMSSEMRMRWKAPASPASSESTEPSEKDAMTASLEEFEITTSAGRYMSTYKLIREGRLPYNATDVIYEDTEPSNKSNEKLDELFLERLRRGVRDEVDCQVCYGLIVDPCISPCGHTYCRECASRVMDHSNLCPLCRKKMYLSLSDGPKTSHYILGNMLQGLFPEETRTREAAIEADYGYDGEHELPLFVYALAFPSMPTYLHIFEPRYRLMIRRALDYGGNRFGMIIPNFNSDIGTQVNPDTAPEPFMQYGTVVTIDRHEIISDGRIMLTAVGTSKFKVLRWGILDGYYRALTERVDDISPAEEETLEAREIAEATAAAAQGFNIANSATNQNGNQTGSRDPSLSGLTTQQLMQSCLDFIEKRRTEAAPWLHRRVIGAFGPPPTDPAIFPYWFASVLPIPDEEAYKLLPMTSIRERLQLAATWPKMLEDSGWHVNTLRLSL